MYTCVGVCVSEHPFPSSHVAIQTLNTELHSLETCYIEAQDSLFQQLCEKVGEKELKINSSVKGGCLDKQDTLCLLNCVFNDP